MARERDPRIAKAFIAMKTIGIPVETVKPVLKRLLILYDRKWELIEENNYSTLADAIFEYENEKKDDANGSSLNDNLETQFKKPRGAQLEDQASSTMESGGRRLDLKEVEKLQDASGQELSLSRNPKDDPAPLLHQVSIRDRGKLPSSTSQASIGEDLLTERESKYLYSDCISVPSFLPSGREIIQEDHKDGNVTPHRRKELGSFTQHGTPTPSNVYPDKGKRVDGSACQYGASLHTFEVASSTCGKVKISLTCKNHAFAPDSRSPNLDAVVKHAEDKYLRSYKIIGPKFSLIQLLKELCNSYLELGSNSTVKFMIKEASGDSLNKIMGANQERVRRDNREIEMNKRIKSSASSNSISLAVAQKKPINREKKIAFRKIHDLTNGTEKGSISLLDETGSENLPDFVYIPQNIIYQCAYVQVSLARISDEDCCASCAGNCLSSSFPCECARDTGGEYAYTPEGLLKENFLAACISMNEEPQKHYHFYCPDCPLERAKNASRQQKCKGHLVRKFVKECWRKCRCSMQCGNRVVQRGITHKLQVFLTAEGKGWGVRTLEELPKGAFVCEYIGEILTNMELYERNKKSNNKDKHTYPVLLDADWGSEGVLKDEDALCLDATYYGNVGRFINHRCSDSNLIDIPVAVETPDHHYYHLAFFTKRKVDALEELTWDYGIDFNDHSHPIEAFKCCCGSVYCRDVKGKGTKHNRSK